MTNTMTNTIQNIINKAVEGLEMTEEQRKTLIGFYLISFYKTVLEIFFGLKSQKVDFFLKINTFFDDILNSLTQEEREAFEVIIEKEKGRILSELLKRFKEKLDPDLQKKIDDNIARLTAAVG